MRQYGSYAKLRNRDVASSELIVHGSIFDDAALPMVPNDPMIARVQGATMLAAGTTLALGFMPKTSARVLALTLIPNTIVGHPFWKFEKPDERRANLVHFVKNAGLFGGLLYISADKRTQPEPED